MVPLVQIGIFGLWPSQDIGWEMEMLYIGVVEDSEGIVHLEFFFSRIFRGGGFVY